MFCENARRIREQAGWYRSAAQERLPALARSERLFRTRPFREAPHPLGGHLDQGDLIVLPHARRDARERQRSRPVYCPLLMARQRTLLSAHSEVARAPRPRIVASAYVIDNDSFASTARQDDRFAETVETTASR